jgi:hypothetical protein
MADNNVATYLANIGHLEVYRSAAPGLSNAFLMLGAPQIGVRHSRRLAGLCKVTRQQWDTGHVWDDEIGVSTSLAPKFPNISVPYGALVPERLDSILGAGRHVACDAGGPLLAAAPSTTIRHERYQPHPRAVVPAAQSAVRRRSLRPLSPTKCARSTGADCGTREDYNDHLADRKRRQSAVKFGSVMYQYYFEAVFVVTRTLDAYREAHSMRRCRSSTRITPHHENYDDHFAVTWRSRGRHRAQHENDPPPEVGWANRHGLQDLAVTYLCRGWHGCRHRRVA